MWSLFLVTPPSFWICVSCYDFKFFFTFISLCICPHFCVLELQSSRRLSYLSVQLHLVWLPEERLWSSWTCQQPVSVQRLFSCSDSICWSSLFDHITELIVTMQTEQELTSPYFPSVTFQALCSLMLLVHFLCIPSTFSCLTSVFFLLSDFSIEVLFPFNHLLQPLWVSPCNQCLSNCHMKVETLSGENLCEWPAHRAAFIWSVDTETELCLRKEI